MSEKADIKKLSVLFLNAFVDMLGYAIVFPLIPLYALRFRAEPLTIGLMVASFSIAQVAASPIWGRLSDRFGRRPALLVSLAGSTIAFIIFGFADGIAMLFVSRIVQGSAGGTTSVMQAYVGDSVPPSERAKALGWLSAATSTGVIIGPALGSAVWAFGTEVPGLVAASLCFLNLVLAWRILPESHQGNRPDPEDRGDEAKSSIKPEKRSIRSMFFETVRYPRREASELIWIYAVAMAAFGSMTAVLAIFLEERFQIDESHIGYVFPFLGAVSVVMRAGILGRLVARFGEVRLMRAGALLLACGLIAFPIPDRLLPLLLILMLMPVGTALLFPSTTALLSRRSPKDQLGQVMGVQQAFGGMARILGPIWAGAAYGRFGPSVPFQVAGVVVLLAAFLTMKVRPEPRDLAPESAGEEQARA